MSGSCCEGGSCYAVGDEALPGFIKDTIETSVGEVPRMSTRLRMLDHLGALRVRLCIGRMDYAIPPGLYAVGSPTGESHILVSANYKLSFDALRRELEGIDAWILVLDTKSVNVWCAAGKGTFGTDEIVRSLAACRLAEIIKTRRLILPQLGAPGVSAHEVRERSGFSVTYGPVRARDIRSFLDAGLKATPEMRRITFTVRDRLKLVPVELVEWGKFTLLIAATMLAFAGLVAGDWRYGLRAVALVSAGYLGGGLLVPVLLPWLPGVSFAVKGAQVGVLLFVALVVAGLLPVGVMERMGWALMLPAVSSFVGMNFTGAATYTSLSGVKREMRLFVPLQAIASLVGIGLWVSGAFA